MYMIFLGVSAALIATVSCDAPLGGGYSYPKPSGGYPSGGGGYPGGGYPGGSSYIQVPIGPATYEGQYVDPQLLEKIKQVLIKEESQYNGGGGYPGGGYPGGGGGYPSSSYGAPSSSYGAPSSSYGPPSYKVDVVLNGVKPAIQVAEYESSDPSSAYGAPHFSSGGGGFSSLGGSYGAPAKPSSSYGAPF